MVSNVECSFNILYYIDKYNQRLHHYLVDFLTYYQQNYYPKTKISLFKYIFFKLLMDDIYNKS